MGCWNGTCGVSELPITVGTEMFVFPIVESYSGSFCYTSALYRPSSLPFRGVYNDYGGAEKCGGVGLDILMEGIRGDLVELDMGENQYHDIPVKKKMFDIDLFFDACKENRLLFKNPMGVYEGYKDNLNVYFTMVRKDVVDQLWKNWTFDLWKGRDVLVSDGFESDQYYVKNVTYEKLAELVPEYMEKRLTETNINYIDVLVNEYRKQGLDEEARVLAKVSFRNQFFTDMDEKHILSDMFRHMFGGGYSDGGFSRIGNVENRIIEEYLEGDKETAYAIIRECMIGYMVDSFMSVTRKVWLPPMHQGSQSDCYEEYELMADITKNIVKSEKAKWDDE